MKRPLATSHQSLVTKCAAFTLVELLVVITVISLLMALLFTVLRRARNQARSVVCRTNLRQLGLMYKTHCAENADGRLVQSVEIVARAGVFGRGGYQYILSRAYLDNQQELTWCPMTSKPEGDGWVSGSVFKSWQTPMPIDLRHTWRYFQFYSSYGINTAFNNPVHPDRGNFFDFQLLIKCSPSALPLLCDSKVHIGGPPVPEKDKETTDGIGPPPPYEIQFTPVTFHVPTILELGYDAYYYSGFAGHFCIDRHDGGINMLFADMSSRKVGLKELWYVKWNAHYDTSNAYTLAGGVQPEDWPKWMRGCKDY